MRKTNNKQVDKSLNFRKHKCKKKKRQKRQGEWRGDDHYFLYCDDDFSKEVNSENSSLSKHVNDVSEETVQRPEGRALRAKQEQILSPENVPVVIKEYKEFSVAQVE